ncbi:putative transcription factor interactor and regulator FHA-SMAD family [Arabidopsis thaliana]|uniref:SMAD/FHA domain-containing protein n=2 Tax=Arabidopsis TaxID=3701 RepID=A0A178VGT0_ARATH|nr:SMAD/FHA domain superfamily [Arabidopsis thaliana x Arabidopsis arenosa]OAP04535.1 hypothetical protein AXX17_AT3G14200 [Arabidopsis thaliana]
MNTKSLCASEETTMEIEGEDGTKLFLKTGVKDVFGRGAGFNTEDLTVSRRHVSLVFKPAAAGTEPSDMVSFEVLGRNPVWIRAVEKGKKIQTWRKPETGEIATGDQFCVSGNHPIWFTLKRRDEVMEERALDHGEIELNIDPVKEFGFLVIGKEFDQYPKSRVRDIKQWEWFLEDSTNGNSDDDEDGDKKGRKGLGKKRRRKKGNEDDDWSVESDEDKELMVKSKRVVTPTYSTRSKKTKKDSNASSSSSNGAQTKQRGRADVEEEDDDDETLGGFIVSDEEAKLEEEEEEDESDVDDEEDEDEEEEEE